MLSIGSSIARDFDVQMICISCRLVCVCQAQHMQDRMSCMQADMQPLASPNASVSSSYKVGNKCISHPLPFNDNVLLTSSQSVTITVQ